MDKENKDLKVVVIIWLSAFYKQYGVGMDMGKYAINVLAFLWFVMNPKLRPGMAGFDH